MKKSLFVHLRTTCDILCGRRNPDLTSENTKTSKFYACPNLRLEGPTMIRVKVRQYALQ